MTGAFLACIGEAAAKGEIAPEVAASPIHARKAPVIRR